MQHFIVPLLAQQVKMKQNMVLTGVGERIRYLRGDESLPSFAKKIGVHKNTLARYEKEESLPDVGIILKLCEIVDDEAVTPDWLIQGEYGWAGYPRPSYTEAHEELRTTMDHMRDFEQIEDYLKKEGRLSISTQNLFDYLEGNYLPTDQELSELCSARHFGYELVCSKRKPRQTQEEHPGTPKNTNRIFSHNILEQVLVAVEDCLKSNDVSLSFEKKANLVTILYEEVYDDKLKGHLLYEKVLRLARLAN
jgi:transcriptional regulator with XRE-family HTH domain